MFEARPLVWFLGLRSSSTIIVQELEIIQSRFSKMYLKNSIVISRNCRNDKLENVTCLK